ncbi:MAG: UvrD-helicase domain-containing protein, partial [Lentisphaerae bacterium]|nr:UvrD-helicase domain-containing protein [Lentisphaerota bacterium]
MAVTFTRDATKELRERLQKALRDALGYLEGKLIITDPYDRTKLLVDLACTENGNNQDEVKLRLQLALLDFDLASISTIHGFCQQVLNRFSFETGLPFDLEPTTDSSEEIENLCRDWWRQNFYTTDNNLAVFLGKDKLFTLHALIRLTDKLISKPDAKLSQPLPSHFS